MNKLSLLIGQVYKQKIVSKSIIFTTILYIAVMSIVMFWSDIKGLFVNNEAIEVAVVNETSVDLGPIFISDEDISFTFPSKSISELHTQVKEAKLDAVIVISEENRTLTADIATFTPLKLNDQSAISSIIQYAGKMYGIQQLNLTAQEAEHLLNAEAIITMNNLNDEAVDGKSEDQKQSGMFVSYFLGIVIYFFISTYLSMVTTDVASEKGSRALEMMLVSVKPSTHFQSKIFGVMLVSLTQFVVIFAALVGLLRLSNDGSKLEIVQSILSDLSTSYLIYVIVFLFLTIFLYLIIGALFGSLVSKVEEASQVMMPAIMITLVGFYVMLSGIANPDTMLIKIFSYIPLTSGMVMPMRIGATDLLAIEPILSLVVLILTVLGMYLLSLNFYKRSVLTYSSGGIIQKIKSVLKFTS